MKKILSILPVAIAVPLVTFSVVSCGKKLDAYVCKILNYTDDKGGSNLIATPIFKNGEFTYEISGYTPIKNKVSNNEITDDKLKSFVEKTLKVTKKEEYKDIDEEFKTFNFDIKVEENKIKFTRGTATVAFKKGGSDLAEFKNMALRDFEMNKADIEKIFDKITEQDFEPNDLKGKASNTQVNFKSDSDAGKALQSFAQKINKKLDIKIASENGSSCNIQISLADLDAKKDITVNTP